ncbi:MAG: flippase-like domain-containing protein, partial [Planctomycetes bacterium]|nr:flippase-like domain-containing protein [Planctomycetota bacterium]
MTSTNDNLEQPKRPSRLRIIASLTLLAIFAGAAWWYLRENWDEVARLRIAKPIWLIPIIAGFIAIFFLQAIVSQGMLRVFSIHMPFNESMRLSNATTLLNFLLPAQGGMGLRAIYLVKVYRCPLIDFVSMTGALAILSILLNTGLGFVAMLWIALSGGPFDIVIAGVFAAILCSVLGGVAALPRLTSLKRLRGTKVERLMNGLNAVKASRRELVPVLYAIVGQSLAAVIGYYSIFSAFGLSFDAPSAIVLLASASVGGLFNFTPGAIGFQELAGMYLATIFPTSPAETLVALGAYKIIWICVAMIFGL